MNLLW